MKILMSSLLILATQAWASPLPEGCQPVNIPRPGTTVSMKANPAAIYVLYNRSGQNVLLDRAGPKPGASAGWATDLASEQASAILLHQPDFRMSCQQKSKDSTYHPVKCARVLAVCRYTNFKAKDEAGAQGNFWVTENARPDELISKLQERGFDVTEP